MVKVRMSEIPEDSPIIKQSRKSKSQTKERDAFDDLLDDFEPDDEEKKVYYKTLIHFPEIGYSVNPSYIQSIEKTFRLRESIYNEEKPVVSEYGILINCGVNASMNSPKSDIELWYKNEEYRNQRYDKLMTKLDEIGIKIVTI